MKKIIKIFFIICFLLLIFIICYKKVKSPLDIQFPFSLFQIKSGSMMPEIDIGEVIILIKDNNYNERDIITYKVDDLYYITHRIEKVTKEGYITKGDSNNTEDEEIVKKEQIQGKVILHSKLLGKIYEYRYYFIVILIILLLI